MSFSDELKKETSNAIKATQEAVKVAAIELFSGVITRTPVGNPSLWENPSAAPPGYTGGSARSNWMLSTSTESDKITDSTYREGFSREQAYAEMAKEIGGERYTGLYILSNNLPYIKRLNENWSTQTNGLGIINPELSRVNSLLPKIQKVANKKYGVDK